MGLIGAVIGNLLQPELVELIAKRDFAQLRAILCDFAPADIAEIFFDLKPDDEAVLLRILPNDIAAVQSHVRGQRLRGNDSVATRTIATKLKEYVDSKPVGAFDHLPRSGAQPGVGVVIG